MKQQLAAGLVAVAIIGGIGTGFAVHEMSGDPASASASVPPSPTPTPTPSPKPSTSSDAPAPSAPGSSTPRASSAPTTPTVLPLGSLQITTGAVGPVRVGMTQAEALATGYFDGDVQSENCEAVTPLEWTSNYYNALDVLTDQSDAIVSLGVRARGPKTRSGLGVDSTYGQVRQVIGTDRLPEPAGYSQTGLFVNDGDAWIGFLFDVRPDAIQDSDAVTFIEVTRGAKPGLMRDGC